MIIKYQTDKWAPTRIRKVEVERETEKCIWIDGRRNSKDCSYDKYHDSWAEARDYILLAASKKFARLSEEREKAKITYDRISRMKEGDQ